MERLLSRSSRLFSTALVFALLFACGEGVESETGSQSAGVNNGRCVAIVATSLGLAQQCGQSACSPEECAELQATFNAFFGSDCAGAFFAGELNGLAGSALGVSDDPKHIQEVICGAAEACDPTCAGVRSVGLCLNTEACN